MKKGEECWKCLTELCDVGHSFSLIKRLEIKYIIMMLINLSKILGILFQNLEVQDLRLKKQGSHPSALSHLNARSLPSYMHDNSVRLIFLQNLPSSLLPASSSLHPAGGDPDTVIDECSEQRNQLVAASPFLE